MSSFSSRCLWNNDEGVAEVIVEVVPENLEEEVKDASESCPVNAIEVNE